MLRKILSSLILTGIMCYGVVAIPEAHNKYLRYEVGESTVRVLHPAANGGGTGFAVKAKSGKEFIMTNRHVCEGTQVNGLVRIQLPGGRQIKGHVFKMDDIHDLCLVSANHGLKALSLGSNQDKGDKLYVVGHPGLRQLTISSEEYIGRAEVQLPFDVKRREECPGKVIEVPPFFQLLGYPEFLCIRQYEALETSAVIYPGNSGSPVVNKWGNLIGVAFAGSTQQEHNNFVIPLRYVKIFLDKH